MSSRGRIVGQPALGQFFQRAREDAQLKQERAAGLLELSVGTLSRYEAGKAPIPLARQQQMAALYGVAIPDVTDSRGTMPAPAASGEPLRPSDPYRFAEQDPRYWSARWDQSVASLRAVLREQESLAHDMRAQVWGSLRADPTTPDGATPEALAAAIARQLAADTAAAPPQEKSAT